jgi:hypothetical protein
MIKVAALVVARRSSGSGALDRSAAEHDAAVTALRDLATGRALLLAEVAGILERTSEICRQIAQLCRDAGAGREAIPAWMEGAQPEGSR